METKTAVHIPVRGDGTPRLPLPTNSRDRYRGSRHYKEELNKSGETKREDPTYVIEAGTNEEGPCIAEGYPPVDKLCQHPTANRQSRIERFSA